MALRSGCGRLHAMYSSRSHAPTANSIKIYEIYDYLIEYC